MNDSSNSNEKDIDRGPTVLPNRPISPFISEEIKVVIDEEEINLLNNIVKEQYNQQSHQHQQQQQQQQIQSSSPTLTDQDIKDIDKLVSSKLLEHTSPGMYLTSPPIPVSPTITNQLKSSISSISTTTTTTTTIPHTPPQNGLKLIKDELIIEQQQQQQQTDTTFRPITPKVFYKGSPQIKGTPYKERNSPIPFNLNLLNENDNSSSTNNNSNIEKDIDKDTNIDKEKDKDISTSPTTATTTTSTTTTNSLPWTIKSYLIDEIDGNYFLDQTEDTKKKREQVYNFVHVPIELEKLIIFGFFVCFDSFLYLFTFLPIRIVIAIYSSMLYHYIRGQAVIKLYVIYNVLEVLDKLCCSFGQDIFDSLFWMSVSLTLPATNKSEKNSRILAPFTHTLVALLYVGIHSLVLFSQVITLNVAINSYNNALLTLMMSNQFVELKGSVFKRFESDNLFQISCSDIVERFQVFIFLMIIFFQNLSDLNWDLSWDFVVNMGSVIMIVWGSELIVDAIKHAFITKFNHSIPTQVYSKFFEILSRIIVGPNNKNFTESTWEINNRIGFVPFPLATIVIRVFCRFIPSSGVFGIVLTIQIYFCLVLLKILIKILILGHCIRHERKPKIIKID
ncbi:hypothetical protein CYY_000832 [Polysphondylium violaceum]|uniref:DUF747 family protein n=1 Tax=Polysphondylium violaceum TaxID=133409 RepID=A0A8J4Q240_9MYCE|nr:hypothetical protein CYY_000832 [Polysphondylium violaceum]